MKAGTIFDLSGEVALVTGASSGLGARFAQVLAANGAKVALVARRKDRLDELCERIVAAGGNAVAIEADVLRQVLMTVGFAFLFQQAALDIWGGNNFDIQPPSALTQSLVIGGTYLPLYRLFMIVGARVIGIVLWLAMEKTMSRSQMMEST